MNAVRQRVSSFLRYLHELVRVVRACIVRNLKERDQPSPEAEVAPTSTELGGNQDQPLTQIKPVTPAESPVSDESPVSGAHVTPAALPKEGFFKRHRDDLVRDGIVGLSLAVLAFGLAAYWQGQAFNRQEMLENTRFVRQVSMDEKRKKPFIGMYLRGASLTGLSLGCDYSSDGLPPESQPDSSVPRRDPWVEAGCAEFGGADLRKADLTGADLRGADLRLANAKNARFLVAEMQNVRVSLADLRNVNLALAQLQNAEFEEVKMSGASIGSAEFEGAKLHEVDLSKSSTIHGPVSLAKAELKKVDFRGADLFWVNNLETATLSEICYNRSTVWPEGFNPPPSDCTHWDGE